MAVYYEQQPASSGLHPSVCPDTGSCEKLAQKCIAHNLIGIGSYSFVQYVLDVNCELDRSILVVFTSAHEHLVFLIQLARN